MSGTRLVTDAVADLPPDLVARWGLTVAPVYVALGGHSEMVKGNKAHDAFYRSLAQGQEHVQTAAPSIAELAALFRRLAEEGAQTIIGLFTASTVSSTADHARLAAREVKEVAIHIIETAQVSLGEGLLVLEAAQAAAAGATPTEIAALIRRLRRQTLVLGVLPSLTYLRRGGRVHHLIGLIGELFRIKPVIFFYEGIAGLWGKARTYRRGLEMVEPLLHLHRLRRVAVLHSRAPAALVADFHRRVSERFSGLSVPLVEIGPVFASHIGPGAIGLALIAKESLDQRFRKLAVADDSTLDTGVL